MVKWLNRLPCKPGVAGSIPGFISLSDETKPWPRLHMTLHVCGTFKHKHNINKNCTNGSALPNKKTTIAKNRFIKKKNIA